MGRDVDRAVARRDGAELDGDHHRLALGARCRNRDHRSPSLDDRSPAASLAERACAELSDGEQQRALIARALAQQPRVLVLDEITAFLDLPRRLETMRLLRDLAGQAGCAILLSSHDLDLALRLADDLWVMSRGGTVRTGAVAASVASGAVIDAFASEGEGIVDLLGALVRPYTGSDAGVAPSDATR
ncbi:MAG: ATP-binding cassette domain-containing protein [Betaproteobacteria bacterium]|nr:ATP-binding cassette domain-containing protein [Betaproteobacteria bacterium]